MFKNIRWETIAEIIITIIILMLTIMSGYKVLSSTLTAKDIAEDRIIAINLAKEWLEGIRYIRDYNWLFYGDRAELCWNHYEDFNNDWKSDWDENNNLDFYEVADWCMEALGWGIVNKIAPWANSTAPQEYILKQRAWSTHWFLTTRVNAVSAGSKINIPTTFCDWDWDWIADTNCWDTLSTEWYWSTSPTAEYFRLCEWTTGTIKEWFLTTKYKRCAAFSSMLG